MVFKAITTVLAVATITIGFTLAVDQLVSNIPELSDGGESYRYSVGQGFLGRRLEDVIGDDDAAAGDDGGPNTIDVDTLLMIVFAISFGVPIVRMIYYKYVSRMIDSAKETVENARKRATERVSDAGRRVTSNRLSGRFK